MKKLLLSLVAILTATFAFATDVEVAWTGATDWTSGDALTYATNGIALSAVKNEGSTAPTLNTNFNDLRIYAKGTLTISAGDASMTKIVFTASAQGIKRQAAITASAGAVAIDTVAHTVTWTGDAKTVSFTVGDKAAYGTDGDAKAGQFDIASPIAVSCTGTPNAGGTTGGETGGDDTPVVGDIVSVADAQAAAAGTELNVKGTVYAVGATSFVVGDATGYIFHYGAAEVKVGDVVTVSGAVSAYGGFNQFKSATVNVVSSGSVKYPEAVVMDGAAMDAWIADAKIQYVQYTGKLTISGSYYNVAVEGAETAVGSIIRHSDELAAKMSNGNEYVFTGFAMYVSGTKYVNTIITDVKAVGEQVVLKDISNTLETAYTVSQAVALIDDANNDLSKKVYIKGIVSAPYKEVFVDHSYGNATFFISEDGKEESQQFEIYRGYSFGGVKFAENEDIKLGDEVIFYGNLTKYNTTYETTQGAELVQLNGKAEFDAINSIQAEKNTAIYDLSGRKLSKAQKGLYIMNGRVIVK